MSESRQASKKRNRTNENFAKSMRSIVRRLDRIHRQYGAEIYVCAKYRKYFEYASHPSLPATRREIVGRLAPSKTRWLISTKDESYPLAVKKTPADFGAGESDRSGTTSRGTDHCGFRTGIPAEEAARQ